MAEWRGWYASKEPIFMFCLKFGALAALLYILLAIPFFENLLHSYLAANAWLANTTLDLFGQDTHAAGTLIESPQFSVNLKRGCDAVEPTWLYCAAVACFPATWRQKLAGMCAGAILLQLLNFIRIVTLYLIGRHLPAFFDSAHLDIWPIIFIIVSMLLFVSWKSWASRLI